MKTLIKSLEELQKAKRWDIDFHLPPEGIKHFPPEILRQVGQVANIVKDKRDPTKEPEILFNYVDIASIDVSIGAIINPQELNGEEAPSRARKVISAFDIIVSTCRPTRGAIAVVPIELHNQIASTAFSIVRANEDINPFYLHYALRLPSTLEQFRKWSTGSSYPAILDDDVFKTLIPVPDLKTQDIISVTVVNALVERQKAIETANKSWNNTLNNITKSISEKHKIEMPGLYTGSIICTLDQVHSKLNELPTTTINGSNHTITQAQLSLV